MLKEDFETGLPTSASSTENTVTLSSGTWRIKSVSGKKDNNSMRALFGTSGAYLVTPALCQPGRVAFNHRSSGAGKKITVEKSVDGGATWEELGVATTSSASTYGSSSFKCSSVEEDTEVLIRFSSNSGSTYIDNVEITLNSVDGSSPTVVEPDDPTYITGQPLVLGYIVAGFLVSPNMPYTASVVDHASVHLWQTSA